MTEPSDVDTRYARGFLAGQAVAYCERIRTGAGLAAQMTMPAMYAPDVMELISNEGCQSHMCPGGSERITIWIYKGELVKRLIQELQSCPDPPSGLDVWSMGKLFGYADSNVCDFIEDSGHERAVQETLSRQTD